MPLLVVTFFIAMVAYLEAQILPAQSATYNAVVADTAATSFLAYRAGVLAYFADSNNSCNGVASNLSKYYPPGFSMTNVTRPWNNLCDTDTKTVYVYETATTTTPPLDENILFDKVEGLAIIGHLDASGNFVGAKNMPLSAGIPKAIVDLNPRPNLIMVGG